MAQSCLSILSLCFSLHSALALSSSKLSVHAGPALNEATTQFITTGQPRLIKLLDKFDDAANIKSIAPGIIVVGRISLQSQPQNGSAGDRANEWWNANKQTILGNPSVDYWEGYDEPDVSTLAACQWMNDFEVARQKIMSNSSVKAVIGSWAVATPDFSNQQLVQAFYPSIDLAIKLGNWLGVHEFSAPLLASGFDNMTKTGRFTGRYRTLYDTYLTPTKRVVPLLISELGIDGAVINQQGGWKKYVSAQGYAAELAWYDAMIQADAYVQGATIFLMDGASTFDSFSIDGDAATAILSRMKKGR